jgi:starch synthase
MAARYPDKVKIYIGFNESLAHQVYAGADLFLMPSLFEPCGLGQLIALQYGTLPIVRETGGLNDTVQSYNESTGEGNGFSFANFNAHDMLHTILRAVSCYHQKEVWDTLVKRAMSEDYSWGQSARQYKELYESLID